jgi:photosystem II stability/assembly factor-like uncharacterized protein
MRNAVQPSHPRLVLLLGLALGGGALGAHAQAELWTKQAPLPTAENLHAVQMLSATELWATGGDGLLVHTLDAGQTWQSQSLPTNSLWALFFLDAQHGWAAGNGFFHTQDGGQSWIQDSSWGSIYDLHFVDLQHGWACGNGGVTYRTTDGGASWSFEPVGTQATLSSIVFVDTQRGWTLDIDGRIYRTINGGLDWTLQWDADAYLSTLQFFDADEGWAIGGDTFLHTVDAGQTWTPANVPAGTWSHGARFANRLHGIAVGEYGNVVISGDGGQSWTQIAPIGSGPRLWDVESLSPTTSVYCGETGIAALTSTGGASWTSLQSGGAGSTHGLDAVDGLRAWAANDGGEILRTTDGGAHWQRIAVAGFDNYGRLDDVDFADAQRGWAVGRHEVFGGGFGKIVRSLDGGLTWNEQFVVPEGYFEAVEALDASTAFALGQVPLGPRFVLRTTNGGQTWNDVSPSQAVFMDVDFVDGSTGWLVGGRIYRTSDGGQSWALQHTPAELLYSVSFADALHGWAVGWGPTLLRTSDGGQTWTPQNANAATNVLLRVWAVGPQSAWIMGGDGYVARTLDGGQSWQTETLPGALQPGGYLAVLESAYFFDADNGWVAGSGIWRRGSGTDCATPETYCLAKANSAGGLASIGWSGTPSVGGSSFALTVADALPQTLGLFFHGSTGAASIPWQNGLLCAAPPLLRLPALLLDANGNGVQPVQMEASFAGTTRWYQFWYRDPAQIDGTGCALSNALEVQFCE